MRKRFVVDCVGHKLALGKKTCLMGILNVTPDSFSDGGLFFDAKKAVRRALEIEREGADVIDIGGESTRPGSSPVPAREQIKRAIPVIRALSGKIKIPVSIDTSDAFVAEEAVKAGAKIINDITGLRKDKNIAKVAAGYKTGLCIMHIKGAPQNMQKSPRYKDLIKEIYGYLKEGIDIARRAGVLRERIIIDPGIGFGKTIGHNLEILKNIEKFNGLDRPVLVGPSRKSFIGKILGAGVDERVFGTAAAAAIAVINGAHIIRAHDVAQMRQAALIADSISEA